MRPERHPQEAARLEALRACDVLDTPDEAAFDEIVGLASRLCDAPIALVSLTDETRQVFKARVGLDTREIPFDISPCAHVILEGGLVEVPDLTQDARFADNPLVTGAPEARFYAGMTLQTPEGLPLGTLCVIDVRPRHLDPVQLEALRVLGHQTMGQLELRRRLRQDERDRQAVQETLERAEVATWRVDLPSLRLTGNALMRRFYNVGEEATEADMRAAVHPDDVPAAAVSYEAALRTGSRYEAEYRATGSDGVERWILTRADRLCDEAGTPCAVEGVGVDITERRRAALVLEAERRQFRRLLDEVPGHVVTMQGPELRYDFANRAFLRFLGREADFLGQTVDEAWPVPPEHVALLRRVMATGEPATGTEVPVADGLFDFVFQPLREPDGTVSGVFVHSLDVSEKVRVREALLRAEERFRAAQETTPDAFAILEAVRDDASTIVDFRWAYANPSSERLADVPPGGLLGCRLLELRPGARETGAYDAFVEVVETGQPLSREMPMSHSAPPVYLRVTAVRVGDGLAVSFADVTERHLAAQALQEAVEARTKELREAVEEAERFNYSISHDLRTPLRAIAATSQILLEELQLDGEHRELLERQSHNAKRLGLLIDGLLRLSRLGRVAMKREPLDLTAMARAVADEIAQSGDDCCEVAVQDGLRAQGDPALIRLVLQNLVGNACKFSRGEGTVRVFRDGDGDAFAVSDEGPGFDMRYAPKIFQPFERLVTDAEFPGTGIGLANVERIVRRHGGRIWAESEPGKGATFRFTLG